MTHRRAARRAVRPSRQQWSIASTTINPQVNEQWVIDSIKAIFSCSHRPTTCDNNLLISSLASHVFQAWNSLPWHQHYVISHRRLRVSPMRTGFSPNPKGFSPIPSGFSPSIYWKYQGYHRESSEFQMSATAHQLILLIIAKHKKRCGAQGAAHIFLNQPKSIKTSISTTGH